MKKKHDFYIFSLIFENINDFQVSIATKRVGVPPYFLQYLDADRYEALKYEITKKFLFHYFHRNCRQRP